jgi:glucokinase
MPAETRTVVGLDVGGTMLKAVALGPDGMVLDRRRRPTRASDGTNAVVDRMVALLKDMIGDREGAPPLAVGVVVPGVVDEEAGIARFAANLGWSDLPLRRRLEDRLGLAVTLGHDVQAGGLAEARLGAGRGTDDFLFLAVGTGVAGAVVIDGRVRRGRHGLAGELGHIVVEPGGRPCGCGGRGCLETVASAAALARRYRELTWGRDAGGHDTDAAEVLRRAARGDPDAAAVYADAVNALATVLASFQSIVDVELIVIGGGLSQAGPTFLNRLSRPLARLLPFQAVPRLAAAQLGEEAGCLGAALLASGHR